MDRCFQVKIPSGYPSNYELNLLLFLCWYVFKFSVILTLLQHVLFMLNDLLQELDTGEY